MCVSELNDQLAVERLTIVTRVRGARVDLSAAFDTVDHTILIQRLRTSFGLNDAVSRGFARTWTSVGSTCVTARAVGTVHRPVWRAAGVRTGPAPVHDVHCRCSQHRRATTSVGTSVRRRHTSLQPVSAKRLDVALPRPRQLHRTCCQLDGHEPSSAERRKDGIHMVRSITSAPPVSVRPTCSWLCSGDTSRLSTRPRRLPGR